MKQKSFEYKIPSKNEIGDFYVSNSNYDAYNYVMNGKKFINYSIIYGPEKSGKTHLGLIWKKNNNAITYNFKNFSISYEINNNVFIDNFSENINEENLFHLINHCYDNNLKILLTSNKAINEIDFSLKDLSSRLKTFHFINIHEPDEELIFNLIIKLLFDKQIIINNPEIVSFILNRIERTYKSINSFIERVDKLSLEKKRQLTIPLIRELL
tara:strand:- start:675 stop:1310 length:636 start_codon:yes stop_codon:yes gene_type:complete